jgi:hypothetical protein
MLVNCVDCGGEISDSASRCPHCGSTDPHPPPTKGRFGKWVIGFICIIIGLNIVNSDAAIGWLSSKTGLPKYGPAGTLSAQEIIGWSTAIVIVLIAGGFAYRFVKRMKRS